MKDFEWLEQTIDFSRLLSQRTVAAVVQTLFVFTTKASLWPCTHASTLWILYGTPTVTTAVVQTVLNGAVTTDKWLCALACSIAIAYAVTFTRM